MEQRIGECGVDVASGHSAPCTFSFVELLERAATQWGAVTVAPHITGGAGLLTTLPPQARMRAWRSTHLHAVAVSSDRVDQGQRDILAGTLPEYARSHPRAQLRACDVSGPDAVGHPFASSWIKLSSLTAAGLDLAFRSPATRVRVEDPRRVAHPCLRAVAGRAAFSTASDCTSMRAERAHRWASYREVHGPGEHPVRARRCRPSPSTAGSCTGRSSPRARSGQQGQLSGRVHSALAAALPHRATRGPGAVRVRRRHRPAAVEQSRRRVARGRCLRPARAGRCRR